MKKIGILTGGGDCPGLNAVIRGVVERCAMQDVKVFGYHEGWRGVIEHRRGGEHSGTGRHDSQNQPDQRDEDGKRTGACPA